MQVTDTTKSVYKYSSHTKETQKQATDHCVVSSALQIAFAIQAPHFCALASLDDPKIQAIVFSPILRSKGCYKYSSLIS